MSGAVIEVLLGALGETLLMVLAAGSVGFALGTPLGLTNAAAAGVCASPCSPWHTEHTFL